MRRTRIKFCGISRPQDAIAAANAGADAIGLVFHPPSSRAVSLEQAEAILAAAPALLTPVGLFVDSPSDHIRHTVARLGIRYIQLHGHEQPEQVASLQPLRVIKAVRVKPQGLAAELNRWRMARANLELSNLCALLLETAAASLDGAPGGAGIENDWNAIAAARDAGAFEGLPPIFLAGGLTPENVGQVVRRLRPYAVDVSSGVEESKGIKSPAKLAEFAHRVRSIDVD